VRCIAEGEGGIRTEEDSPEVESNECDEAVVGNDSDPERRSRTVDESKGHCHGRQYKSRRGERRWDSQLMMVTERVIVPTIQRLIARLGSP
jgi:hypothetical protein